MTNYEGFDDHIKSETHLKRAKNQAHLAKVDDIIATLNLEERWLKWEPEPKKTEKNKPLCQFKITNTGKIIQ